MQCLPERFTWHIQHACHDASLCMHAYYSVKVLSCFGSSGHMQSLFHEVSTPAMPRKICDNILRMNFLLCRNQCTTLLPPMPWKYASTFSNVNFSSKRTFFEDAFRKWACHCPTRKMHWHSCYIVLPRCMVIRPNSCHDTQKPFGKHSGVMSFSTSPWLALQPCVHAQCMIVNRSHEW